MTTHASFRSLLSPRTSVSNEIRISVYAHLRVSESIIDSVLPRINSQNAPNISFAFCIGSVHSHIHSISRPLNVSERWKQNARCEWHTNSKVKTHSKNHDNWWNWSVVRWRTCTPWHFIKRVTSEQLCVHCTFIRMEDGVHEAFRVCPHGIIYILKRRATNNILCDRKRKATLVRGMLFFFLSFSFFFFFPFLLFQKAISMRNWINMADKRH